MKRFHFLDFLRNTENFLQNVGALSYNPRVETPQKRKEGKMPKYQVEVQLVGEDGNAFAIMGRVKTALKKAGASDEEISQYFSEATSGDYDNLLRVTMNWVEVA